MKSSFLIKVNNCFLNSMWISSFVVQDIFSLWGEKTRLRLNLAYADRYDLLQEKNGYLIQPRSLVVLLISNPYKIMFFFGELVHLWFENS